MSDAINTFINSPVLIVITIIFIIILIIGFFGDKYIKKERDKRKKEEFEKKQQELEMKKENELLNSNDSSNSEKTLLKSEPVKNGAINNNLGAQAKANPAPFSNAPIAPNMQPPVNKSTNDKKPVVANTIPGSTMNAPMPSNNNINNMF